MRYLNFPGLGKHLTKETLLKLIERAEIKKEEKAVNNMIDLGIDIFGTSEIQDRRVSTSRLSTRTKILCCFVSYNFIKIFLSDEKKLKDLYFCFKMTCNRF